jgi:hypothetical protein
VSLIAPSSTSRDAALALKASASAGQLTPDLRGWTEISWSNEGIEYWRRGDRLFLPPSEDGGEWRELLSPRQPILPSEDEVECVRELPPLPQLKRRHQRKPRLPMPGGLLTAAQAAAKLNCSTKTLNGYVATGRLKYVAIGHGKKRPRKMFTDADLNQFIAAQTREAPPCPSSAPRARVTGTSTSGTKIIAFTAQPRPPTGATPKK